MIRRKPTRKQVALERLATKSRPQIRAELEACGYSHATASAAADIFVQVIESVAKGKMAAPLSGMGEG